MFKNKILINLMKELINIPKNDLRKYGYGILDNKIKYVLVEDEKIDTSCVSVVVKTGFINEPIEFQGLAHFLEHMLFLGSKKYPKEDFFDETLNNNGGYSNASTDTFETNYFFQVNTNKLEKCIDIFSRFFIDPLFNNDSIDREVNNVQSEHDKNISNDWRIIFYLINKFSKKDSQVNKFGTGNLETLKKNGLLENMIKFYNEYYCSDNITVSIISSLKLKKQESFLKNYFGEIKYKKSKKFNIIKPLYPKNNDSYHYVSIGKTNKLLYMWEIPYWIEDIKFNSWSIISSVFNDQGNNSLETFLKAKGLINYLFIEILNQGVFILAIDLISDNEKYLNLINSYVLYFINNLKILNWSDISLFNQKNRKLIYNNGSRDNPVDLVNILATNSHYYEMSDILSTSLINHIDEKRIINLIDNYLDIDKCFQLMVSKKEKKIKYKTDKYYFAKYGKIKKIKSDAKKFNFKFETCNSYLDIKPKNLKVSSKLKIPQKINSSIWFGSTSEFNEPLFYSRLSFHDNNYINTPRKYLLNLILIDCINHYISRNYNQEFKIGFNIFLNLNINCSYVTLGIQGFNDKFNLLFDNVINFINNLHIESYVFKSLIKSLKDSFYNYKKISSWEFIEEKISEQINKYNYEVEDLLNEIKLIKLDDVRKIKKYLFSGKLTVFYYGNIKKNNLPNLDIFKKILKKKDKKLFNFDVPKSITYNHPNKRERNNCINILYPCFQKNIKNTIKILFINNMISQPFFNEMRTKEKLGYRVNCNSRLIRNYYYMYEKIESSKNIDYILDKLSNFRKFFYETLLNMDSKTWEKWKKTIKNNLEQREESTSELFSNYYSEILIKEYNFDIDKDLLKELPNIKLKDIQKFYKKYILNNKKKIEIKLVKKK